MGDHRSMLCVGGPRSGQRYAILHGSGFKVPVTRAQESEQIKHSSDPYKVEIVDYRAEHFNTPQGEVSFWVPAQQTPLQTITLLLEAYEKIHSVLKSQPVLSAAQSEQMAGYASILPPEEVFKLGWSEALLHVCRVLALRQ
jgi:hypothetical protein